MYELKDKIKLTIKTLKSQNQSEESLTLISLLDDAFEMILERNKELDEAIHKLDMLSVDLVRRDTHRAALLKIEDLEQKISLLESN